MENVLQKLQGKKTHITNTLIVLVEGMYVVGYINEELRNALLVVLGAASMTFLRMGVKSSI